jgi:hypothetical protein
MRACVGPVRRQCESQGVFFKGEPESGEIGGRVAGAEVAKVNNGAQSIVFNEQVPGVKVAVNPDPGEHFHRFSAIEDCTTAGRDFRVVSFESLVGGVTALRERC